MTTDTLPDDVRAENEALRKQLAEMAARFEGYTPPRHVDTGPRPQYRLLKPFYGPNDHYYDPEEGEEVIEWTGTPNEAMEPLNGPARVRMLEWLETLPGGGDLPIDLIMEAAMKMRPVHGQDDAPLADFAGNVMREAIRLRNAREGKAPVIHELAMPHKVENVPVMGGGKTNRKPISEVIGAVPQPPKPRGRPKRVFGAGVTEGPIEVG